MSANFGTLGTSGAVISELLRIEKKLRWLERDCANLVATFEGPAHSAPVLGKSLASGPTKDYGGFRIISKSLGVYTGVYRALKRNRAVESEKKESIRAVLVSDSLVVQFEERLAD